MAEQSRGDDILAVVPPDIRFGDPRKTGIGYGGIERVASWHAATLALGSTVHVLCNENSISDHPNIHLYNATPPEDSYESKSDFAIRRAVELILQHDIKKILLYWEDVSLFQKLAATRKDVWMLFQNTPSRENTKIAQLGAHQPNVTFGVLSKAHADVLSRASQIETAAFQVIGSGIDTSDAFWRTQPDFDLQRLSRTKYCFDIPILQFLQERGKDFSITIGGIGPHKGQKTAREIALGIMPLILCGLPNPRSDRDVTYDRELRENPLIFDAHRINDFKDLSDAELNCATFMYGSIEKERSEMLAPAACFIMPSGVEMKYEEAWGLARAEAGINGVPQLVSKSGALPEAVLYRRRAEVGAAIDGSGFVFDSIREGRQLLKGPILDIPREVCIELAERKNSIDITSWLLRSHLVPRLAMHDKMLLDRPL